jgi:hypothetical protein
MIQCKTFGPKGKEYEKWCARANAYRLEMIEHWRKTGVVELPKSRAIWSELKAIFLDTAFHEKCAYCEGKHSDGYPSDVEHYRPKKGVTESRQCINHPGYFWLAYEWYNLLLACRHCNSRHSEVRGSERISHPGKLNEFRVEGSRIPCPSGNPATWRKELEAEKPLLLNPYLDNPAEHIAFDDNGVPYAKSARGRETIEVCHLNREHLNQHRRDATERAYARLVKQLEKAHKGLGREDPYFGPEDQFSAWLNQWAAVMVKLLFVQSGHSFQEVLGTNGTEIYGLGR